MFVLSEPICVPICPSLGTVLIFSFSHFLTQPPSTLPPTSFSGPEPSTSTSPQAISPAWMLFSFQYAYVWHLKRGRKPSSSKKTFPPSHPPPAPLSSKGSKYKGSWVMPCQSASFCYFLVPSFLSSEDSVLISILFFALFYLCVTPAWELGVQGLPTINDNRLRGSCKIRKNQTKAKY